MPPGRRKSWRLALRPACRGAGGAFIPARPQKAPQNTRTSHPVPAAASHAAPIKVWGTLKVLPPKERPHKGPCATVPSAQPHGGLPNPSRSSQILVGGGGSEALPVGTRPHHHGFELHAAGEQAAAAELQGFPEVLLAGFGDPWGRRGRAWRQQTRAHGVCGTPQAPGQSPAG